MSCNRTKLSIGWGAVLGLVMLSGCSGQQSRGDDKGNVASKPASEAPLSVQAPADSTTTAKGKVIGESSSQAPPTVQTPAGSTKGGRGKERPPVNRVKESPTVAELIAAAKQMKEGAIEALAAAGPKAIPAILAELRRDDRSFSWAIAAMAKMGHGAVEPVVALLNDGDSFMRKIAYMTLGQMGPTAMSAVPALQRAAQQDRDPRTRGLAANAISQITRR